MGSVAAPTKRMIAIVLAVILVAAVALAAATSGLGQPGLPEGDVALVDGVEDGTVTQEDLDAGLEQSAAQGGIAKVPAPDDPQYQQLLDQTMQSLILAIWVEGEAGERGITVSQTDIDAELERIKEQSFGSEKEFQQFVEQSKFTEEDVQEQVKLTLLRDRLEQEVVAEPTVTDDEVEQFYEINTDSFVQPASRDVRVILNSSEKQAAAAKTALEADDSDASWEKVATEFSQDQTSKDRGGLLEGLTEGQGDPELEAEAFAAAEGELVGPFETERGFYVLQVSAINEEAVQPLEEASAAIRQQLVAAKQQQVATEFQTDFVDTWTPRTVCAPEVEMELCSNFVPPVPEPVPGQPTPPAVVSTQPIEPGTSTLSIDGSVPQGLPQGPQGIPSDPAAGGELPPGSVPIGPDGAPAPAPAGTAPPTATPPATAP